ncbi:MAG: NifU family protein [Bacteroidetes bacterium]|nr:NifU family protein [Bacteroidota bacterium]
MADQAVLESQIEDTIENQIRPYIEADGGRITFIEMKDNIVYVELAGACGTCPSAQMTLKGGVEAILKRRFPEIVSVELARSENPFFV